MKNSRQENDDLAALAGKLREQVYKLQQELQWHVNNGCQMTMKRAGKIAELLSIPSAGGNGAGEGYAYYPGGGGREYRRALLELS